MYYPDTLVGTDSHTTMINGVGVVGWGVGGIEAEAAMLGQPVYMLTPDVVGFELTGRLREGCTATDLVLTVTELLRKHKVVGKFVEFFGEGTRTLAVPDRATIGNMAPEYGATMGFFPVDEKTIDYFRGTGRSKEEIEALEAYFRAQGLFGIPLAGEIDYSQVVQLDLGDVTPSLSGPKRPQDRIELGKVAQQFTHAVLASRRPRTASTSRPKRCRRATCCTTGGETPDPKVPDQSAGAAGRAASPRPRWKPTSRRWRRRSPRRASAPSAPQHITIGNGDVLIAAITSCTNTSNPGVLLAAGLLAKKAVEAGLRVQPHIKTSLAPGSRIVTEYLTKAGLLPYLEQLGFTRGRLRLHHLHRQLRRPGAGDQRGHHQERPGVRGGALGQPQLRGAHPSEHQGQLPGQPAAGGGLCDRRHRAARPDDRAGGQGQRRQGRLAGRHLAVQRRDPQADEVRHERQGLPRELRAR